MFELVELPPAEGCWYRSFRKQS